jgi:hypothetical protein
MNNWRNSWALYSVGIFVVWLIVMLLVWKLGSVTELGKVAVFFAGYFFGWLSATIKHFLILYSRDQRLRN